jgi:hypothetical protein
LQFETSQGKRLARPYLKNKLGVVTHVLIPATLKAEIRGLRFGAGLGKVSSRLYLKNKQTNNKPPKRTGGVAQVVECPEFSLQYIDTQTYRHTDHTHTHSTF